MSTVSPNLIRTKGFAKTLRRDKWWIYPGIIVFGLTSFLVYGFWSAWQADFYWYSAGQDGFGGYLAPFYSPLLYCYISTMIITAHCYYYCYQAKGKDDESLLLVGIVDDLRGQCDQCRCSYSTLGVQGSLFF